jgi:cell division protein FtsI/penicillin-binding protein 2
LALISAVALSSGGCASGPSPDPIARKFLSDWSSGRLAQAAGLTDGNAAEVSAALSAFAQHLDASRLGLQLLRVNGSGAHASARFSAQVSLAGLGTWRYGGSLAMTRSASRWLVHWQSGDLYPALGPGDRLVAVRTLPPRAPLLDRNGAQLQPLTPVVTVGVVPSLLKPRKQNVAILARVLRVDGAALARAVAHAPGNEFLPLITLRRQAYESLKAVIYPLAGVHFERGVLPLGPTPGFGRAVLGEVGPATAEALRSAGALALPSDDVGLNGLQRVYQRQLAGSPSGHVQLLNSGGLVISTPFSLAGHTGTAVRTTLGVHLQKAAEKALLTSGKPAALVAVRASTGQILAVANRPKQSTYNLALAGSLPPGSTFKVITTAVLLQRGFDPRSRVPCPPTVTVRGKQFKNFAGESARGASFTEDFAKSCNDAFISLARRVPGGDLAATAQRFGFGSRWSLPLGYFSGQAPAPANDVERAAAVIGQGRILASPLNMALVAAAVDSGAWRPPSLLPGGAVSPTPLSARVVAQLRRLMRVVVTSGTGTAANVPGQPVFGKTGTAEFGSGKPPPTDAWFIGFRGDVAFAVVVQGGGVGGQVAAPIAASFLRSAS